MNPQTLLFLTSFFGIVPAILILYYLLNTYEDYLKDNTLYAFFAGGMILGMVSFVLHLLIDPQVMGFLDIAILIYVLAFAVFEELTKYIILYLKWFRAQHSTTYYGLAFGLGFGATSIIAVVYRDLYPDPTDAASNPYFLPTAIFLAIGFVGLYATTGGLIGYGSAKKIRWNFLWLALAYHILFNFMVFWYWFSWFPARLGQAMVLAGIGLFGVYFFRTDFMPLTLTRRLSRERRRMMKQRRFKRKGSGEKGPGVPGITFGEKPKAVKSEEE
jgi:uncharacterized membrane protein YhfC